MLFNSYIFILLFLPLTLVGYFLLHHFNCAKAAKIELLLMSLLFYGYFNVSYVFIICFSIVVNYLFSKILVYRRNSSLNYKFVLVLAVACNILVLFYFKYFDFLILNVNTLFKSSFELKYIILPLGISFFTFQQVSYLIDSYRGETRDYNFLDYAVFVSFFPQLVAGPIVLHKEIIPQFEDKKNYFIDYANLSHGVRIFAIGLAKKVLLADTFGRAVTWGFGISGGGDFCP